MSIMEIRDKPKPILIQAKICTAFCGYVDGWNRISLAKIAIRHVRKNGANRRWSGKGRKYSVSALPNTINGLRI